VALARIRRLPGRCRTNSAHGIQSRPDSGLGFQVKIFNSFQVDPASLGGGHTTWMCSSTKGRRLWRAAGVTAHAGRYRPAVISAANRANWNLYQGQGLIYVCAGIVY